MASLIQHSSILTVIESLIFLILASISYAHAHGKNESHFMLKLSTSISLGSAFTSLTWLLVSSYTSSSTQRKQDKDNQKQLHVHHSNRTFAGDPDGISMASSLLSTLVTAILNISSFPIKNLSSFPHIPFMFYYSILISITELSCIISHVTIRIRHSQKLNNWKLYHQYQKIYTTILFYLLHVFENKNSFFHSKWFWIALVPFITIQSMGEFVMNGTQTTTKTSSQTSSKTQPRNTNLSLGEQSIIVSFISLILTDFFIRYIILPHVSPSTNFAHYMPIDSMAISHGGFVGCILGCIISYRIVNATNRISYSLSILTIIGITAFSALSCIEIILELNPVMTQSPKCVYWIISFLSSSTQTNSILHSFDTNQWIMTIPKASWLIYWLFVLILMTPIAMSISKKHQRHQNEKSPKKQDTLFKSNTSKSSIVISRKFFHFVAIVLFTPSTIYAPSMMSLSYAIAICLLILLECIRLQHHHHHQYTKSKHTIKKQTTLEWCMHNMNEFYASFLDEKENKDQFILTHVGLVSGCALPLWLHQSIFALDSNLFLDRIMFVTKMEYTLLPFVGIISLGVGDAAGAIIGTLFGRTLWSKQSKRTIEGSLGMFLSMVVSCILLGWYCNTFNTLTSQSLELQEYFGVWICLIIMTLMEACTDQIDNLCLPFIGSISFLLSLKSNEVNT